MTNMIDLDDEGKMRSLELEGNVYIFELRDPYGFCHITSPSIKKLPEALEGAFTSFAEAERHVRLYESNKKLAKNQVEEIQPAPASIPAKKSTKKVKAALEDIMSEN